MGQRMQDRRPGGRGRRAGAGAGRPSPCLYTRHDGWAYRYETLERGERRLQFLRAVRLLDTRILALGEANGAVHFEARCRRSEHSWRSTGGHEAAHFRVQEEKLFGINRMKNPAR